MFLFEVTILEQNPSFSVFVSLPFLVFLRQCLCTSYFLFVGLALNLWFWDCWHVSSCPLNLVFFPHFSVMPGLSQCLVHDSNYSTAEQHLQSLDLILIFSYYSWESPKKPNMHVLYLIFIPIILFGLIRTYECEACSFSLYLKFREVTDQDQSRV